MAAHGLSLSTGVTARFGCVFAIPGAMTVLPAEMRAALEQLSAYLTAARICQPAGHVFQHPLSAQTRLLGQEWTLGTVLLVCVAGMCGLRVAASLWTLTGEVASGRLCSTRLRGIQNRSSAITRNLFEHCLPAGIASTLVAKLRACVPSAFQHPATYASTDMLCLDVLISRAKMGPEFTTCSLALVRPLLSRTAPFSACMSTTVQSRLAHAWTLGRLILALVTDCQIISTTTVALDVNIAQASATGSNMTQLFASMTTWQCLATRLLTIQDRVFAGGTRCISRDLR